MLRQIYEQAGEMHRQDSLNFEVSVKLEPLQLYNQ